MGMPLPDDVVAALNKTAGIKDAPKPPAAPPTTEQPTQAPQIEPKPPVAAPETPEVSNSTPRIPTALREAYEKAKARLQEIEEGILPATQKQQKELEAKVADYETKLSAYKGMEAKLKQVDDERGQYEERLRVIDYTQHPEFHEKFVRPVAEAMQNANLMVGEMMVQNDSGERPGTEQDFQAVLRSPNLTEAMRTAKVLFGDDLAGTVVGMRNQVLTAERTRLKAYETAALKSKEAMERQFTEQAETQSRLKTKYETHSKKVVESDATLAQPDPTDKEAWDAYEQGAAMADEVVRGSQRGEDDRIANLALVRHRASVFPVLQLKMTRLQKENADLKERIAAFERSEPTNGSSKSVPRDGMPGNQSIEDQTREALQRIADRKGR